jgi:hypothetical protein
MSEGKPVRCQKCGKPIGYVTVLFQGAMGMQQSMLTFKVFAMVLIVLRSRNSVTPKIAESFSTHPCNIGLGICRGSLRQGN